MCECYLAPLFAFIFAALGPSVLGGVVGVATWSPSLGLCACLPCSAPHALVLPSTSNQKDEQLIDGMKQLLKTPSSECNIELSSVTNELNQLGYQQNFSMVMSIYHY